MSHVQAKALLSPPPPPPPTTTPTSATTSATSATMPPSKDLTHFLTIPWCASLLTAPTTTLLPTPSRVPKSSTEDSFFALTLRTGETVPHMLSFSSPRLVVSPPAPAAPAAAGGKVDAEARVEAPAPGISTEQVSTLFALGEGINGYPATAHGGVTAALFDEAMGVCMMRLRASAAAAATAAAAAAAATGDPKSPPLGQQGGVDIVTASLTVDFLRRVETPGVVVVRVWVAGRRGRKWLLEGEMVGEGGVVVGRARGVWVEVRAGL